MRTKGREQGRFVALSGFRRMAGAPGGRYEVLIIDGNGKPVSPLCEWYRLRKRPGANGTRRTYLNFLQPFFAHLLSHGYAWNAAPSQVRSYVKAFLLEDIGCSVSPDTALDGYRLTLTGSSPLSASSLRVLLAAIRDFYAVMAEAGLYAYANPMCSQILSALEKGAHEIHCQCWRARSCRHSLGELARNEEPTHRLLPSAQRRSVEARCHLDLRADPAAHEYRS